ncbi:hypothetical protein [Desulfovibrio litoralis]|uniref:Uncharacterized protein n=1 Tax=Desulfovibrio litoralis DSM 11393 TaxID=1121455 RepID=A0A1M7T860_9BACT|nr:hypothetical protein [Desulfovibrio litoralis]SHN66920.1 hypothetical protein SAMN02745728_01710 [Desulfovibrio litoralis DSM 11393]
MPRGQKSNDLTRGHSWADVAMVLVRGVLQLINSGNIIGLIIAGFVFDLGFISYKLTPEDSGRVLLTFIDILKFDNLSYILMPAVFVLYFLWSKREKNYLKKELKRLAEERTALMLGLKDGTLKPLKQHYPSSCDDKME